MTIGIANFSGTQSVGTTEWSLTNASSTIAANTTIGMFQACIDLNAVAAGDVFEFRLYEKARAADTQRLAFSNQFQGAQGAPLWYSPPTILGAGWDMTLKKIAGTDRTITWSIRGST